MTKIHLVLFLLFPLEVAQARVFNMGDESLAAYLRGSFWTSPITNTLLSESNGPSSVSVTESFANNTSGELGMVYGSKAMKVRLGLEVIRPPEIKNAQAVNSTSAALYNLTSEVSVVTPKIGFEFGFSKAKTTSAFLYVGAGSANLAARNAYAFTAQGLADLGVPADYDEDLRATATLLESSIGFDTLLSDTTTFSLEAGYRDLNFTKVKHNREATTISQGAVIKGDLALNSDGTNRSLKLSGPFIVVQLRFWLR